MATGTSRRNHKKGKGFARAALVLGIFGSCLGLIPILGIVALPLGDCGPRVRCHRDSGCQ